MTLLTHQTRIAVNLIVEDDTGTVADFLATLTILIGLLVAIGQLVSKVALFVADLIEAADFTLKVFVIGLNALAFGMGVRL